jgi:hypothetical protein
MGPLVPDEVPTDRSEGAQTDNPYKQLLGR